MTWPVDDNAPVLPEPLVAAFQHAARARVGSIPELAESLGMDEAAAGELVDDWERAGLATVDDDGLRLRDPAAAVGQYLDEWLSRQRRDLAGLRQLVGSAGALSAIWRESFENDATGYTIDRIDEDGRAWFAWWSYLVERPGARALAILSNLEALALMEGAAPGHLDRLLGMLQRGETALSLLVPAEAREGQAAAVMQRLAAAGAAVRVGDTTGWFAVGAGTAALVPAVWGKDRGVAALLVREPSIVAALEELFRLRWRAASRWEHGRPRAAADQAIAELCRGRTDEEVARLLGISVRSVRRRVAAALAETGASSRMELGCLLGSCDGAEQALPQAPKAS